MEQETQGLPSGEQASRDVVARQEASGLTVRAFCLREGLKEWSPYDRVPDRSCTH
jgi:hypothetical protein